MSAGTAMKTKEFAMGLFDSLTNMTSTSMEAVPEGANADMPGAGLTGGLACMLGAGTLDDIARTMLANKGGDLGWLKTAFFSDAGTALWKKMTDRVCEANAAIKSGYGSIRGTADQHAARVLRAIVFAAKSDGHLDDQEQEKIVARLQEMEIGREGAALLETAMAEPLDPELIANDVNEPNEALELYTISAAIVDSDKAMEMDYLDSLAAALNIPQDVRDQVDQRLRAQV